MAIAFALLGIACILYGLFVALTTSGGCFYVFWFFLAAFLIGGAVLVGLGWWGALPAWGKVASGAVIGVACAGLLGALALIARHANDAGEEGLDYLIVLGAQLTPYGPSRSLRFRLDTAYDYLVRNEETKCIVSGGQGRHEPLPEAEGMAAYLIARGIAPERIACESKSTNTKENIAFSMELLDPATDRVGIVTNDFHMYRSLRIARKAGFTCVCGIAAPSTPWYLPNNLARESLGIAKGFIVGNM